MKSAVRSDDLIVFPDVCRDLGDLGHSLLRHRAVMTFHFLAADELLAIAESAVRRTGRDHVHQAHLVLVKQAFDGAVIHLMTGIFRTCEVGGFGRTRLHDPLDRFTVACQFEVMPCDLHRHSLLDIPIGALEHFQAQHFIIGIKGHHVLRSLFLEEGGEAVDDFAFMAGFFNGFKERTFPISLGVFEFLGHQALQFKIRRIDAWQYL